MMMLRMRKAAVLYACVMLLFLILPACAAAVVARQPVPSADWHAGSPTPGVTAMPWPVATPTVPSSTGNDHATQSERLLATVQHDTLATVSQPTANPDDWKQWPVIPTVSDRAKALYLLGQQMGNNPHAFSKVGDCQNITRFFLGPFDQPKLYRLGPYQDLQETIDTFKGSFGRSSVAVSGGFNAASVINPYHVDEGQCKKDETPVSCELRLNKPAFVVISLETWYSKRPASVYEGYLRQVVDTAIRMGVVPILATKADNMEGDDSINHAIARVASDTGMPLWNFWAAVQSLPGQGHIGTNLHLTGLAMPNYFDDANAMTTGWPWRNLTALQALDAVRRAVTQSN
jgi:hypothetical protein